MSNAAGYQSQVKGLGAATDTNAVFNTQVGRKLFFEGSDFIAQYVPPALYYPVDGIIYFLLMCQILSFRICAGYQWKILTSGT
jgi:hypothetical protein